MAVSDKFISALNTTIQLAGTQVRIRYYDPVFDETYDEAQKILQSGTDLWISGVVLSISSREGSDESVLLGQGKLADGDKKLYVNGSIVFTGSAQLVDVQLGSPTGNLYTTIPEGGTTWETNGVPIYKRQFIRRLTGSLI